MIQAIIGVLGLAICGTFLVAFIIEVIRGIIND